MRLNFRFLHQAKRFWKTLGPGLITGASDDDPSAITTFSQAGAAYGLSTLWMAVLAYPILAIIQEMYRNNRISNISGMLILLLMLTNLFVLGYFIFIR